MKLTRADMIEWLEAGALERLKHYQTANTNHEKKRLKKAAHIMQAIAKEL